MEQINKIIIISTPYSGESRFIQELKKYFKHLEINEIKQEGKIRGYSPSFLEIDSITCRNKIENKIFDDCESFKKKIEDATLKIAGTN